jgi:hypothetical protein
VGYNKLVHERYEYMAIGLGSEEIVVAELNSLLQDLRGGYLKKILVIFLDPRNIL